MAKFVPKRFEQILTQMIAKLVARTGLSDVSDSSAVKQILAAAARQDDEQYYQMGLLLQLFSLDKAEGDDLDERAKDVQPSILIRITAQKSTGNLVFSSSTVVGGTVNIPIGTKVKTGSGDLFVTTSAGSITPTSPIQIGGHLIGQDSGLVGAVADVAGSAGNVAIGAIVKLETKPVGVDEVTNLTAFVNGLDKEGDDAFRQRIKDFIAGLARCTVGAIEAGVIGQQDPVTSATVLFAKVVEDVVLRGEVSLFIDDGTGTAETSAAIIGENLTEGIGTQPYQKGIVPVPSTSHVDGETFTLGDGATTIVFEFDDDASVVESAVLRQVDFSGGPHTASEMGAIIRAAIDGSALASTNTGDFPVVVTHTDIVAGVITASEIVAATAFVAGTITSALGGETILNSDEKPIKDSIAVVMTSSTRGVLARDTGVGGDFTQNSASGKFIFDPALVQGEILTLDYTHFTGLVQYIQKVVDGDADDRTNFPGLRAAGVRVTTSTPQILLQNVTATVTVADGFDQTAVLAAVKTAISTYINGLSISGDVVLAEMIKRIMQVAGTNNVNITLPATDVNLLDDQLARTTANNLVIS